MTNEMKMRMKAIEAEMDNGDMTNYDEWVSLYAIEQAEQIKEPPVVTKLRKWANKLFIGYTAARLIIYYLFCRIFSNLWVSEDSTQFFSSLDFKISASVLIICCLLYIAVVVIVQKYTITGEDCSFNPSLVDNVITGCIMVVGFFILVFNLGDSILESPAFIIGWSLPLLGGLHFFIKGLGDIWE